MRKPSVEIIIQGGEPRHTAMALRLEAIGRQMAEQAAAWLRARLAVLPALWGKHVAAEHGRRGGLDSQAANLWLVGVTKLAPGRLPLAASDLDLREAAVEAARVAEELAREESTLAGVRRVLEGHCRAWGIEPAPQRCERPEPALLRMLCQRWWLRRLRRAHGRRCEGAAIAGGVVRRGLWPYASQDAVQRREDQKKRSRAAIERAYAEASDGERVEMAAIVEGSMANPEVKRAELMVRIRGADGYAALQGWACEFWTMTTPSRFHAQRITGFCSDANPGYSGELPRAAQGWLCRVWARARAAWKRRGLQVAGLRTCEPHHDGTPHWHLIAYGPAADLAAARELLAAYALEDSGDEPGAQKHRFNWKAAEGKGAAWYAAAYVSKNIDGGGMEGETDQHSGKKMLSAVKRVDAWAAHWGIRQFQFFGMPPVGIWRTLRRVEGGALPAGSALERARVAADDSDWCGFWTACAGGALSLVKLGAGRLTEYGDMAAGVVAGVAEGGRRLMLKAREWVIVWGRAAKKAAGVGFDLPRSCVTNCTQGVLDIDKARVKRARIERDFADQVAAIFDDPGACGPEKMRA